MTNETSRDQQRRDIETMMMALGGNVDSIETIVARHLPNGTVLEVRTKVVARTGP